MMWKKKYPIEDAAEKLFNQIRVSLKTIVELLVKLVNDFIHIPRKEIRMYWLIKLILAFTVWDLSLIAIIKLITGR